MADLVGLRMLSNFFAVFYFPFDFLSQWHQYSICFRWHLLISVKRCALSNVFYHCFWSSDSDSLTIFNLILKYRASHPAFIVPYHRYVKSISDPISTGTRFKMRFEVDDSPDRRCMNYRHPEYDMILNKCFYS